MSTAKFSTGTVVSTPSAQGEFDVPTMAKCLERHVSGDWGDVDAHDRSANERSLKEGSRLMSVYKFGAKTLWIITEAEDDDGKRSATTFLLPEDY
jgi:hypothetical protein